MLSYKNILCRWWKNWTLEQLEEVGDRNAFVWIGVQKDRLINSWVYADGERPINHEFWQVGQPGSFSKDNDCVGINTRFTTAQCNQFYPFICQYEVDNQTQNQQEVQTVSPETIAGKQITVLRHIIFSNVSEHVSYKWPRNVWPHINGLIAI